MGRMHTHNHGKSHSIRPIELKKPGWVKMEPKEIEELMKKAEEAGVDVVLDAEKKKLSVQQVPSGSSATEDPTP